MNPRENYKARTYLQAAKQAFRDGNRTEARKLALQAVGLDPMLEDAWLLLAGLASPKASLEFLQKALQINPNSERARKGMEWAMARLNSGEDPTRPHRVNNENEKTEPVSVKSKLQEPAVVSEPVDVLRQSFRNVLIQTSSPIVPPAIRPERQKSILTRPRKRAQGWLAIPLTAIILVCLSVIAFFTVPRIVASASSSSSALRPTNALFKPSLTPTPTQTPTPTVTPTPTPTPTPTDIPTPLPTDTPVPLPTQSKPSSYTFPGLPEEVDGDARWIDVDLSDQLVYAYEGDNVVNSFLVSTGTSAHPTVRGEYHIYVKYVYDDMSGPGYYLPDVPYVMYFYQGYSLHGTYWHHNFGTPMSHGCVNMYTPDAQWLFDWASVGTLVNVHY